MSDYRDLRKDHPEWPARLKDWEGRSVRLKYTITTLGGVEFKAGDILQVYSQWRGHLHLEHPSNRKKIIGESTIRKVHLASVELLPEKE